MIAKARSLLGGFNGINNGGSVQKQLYMGLTMGDPKANVHGNYNKGGGGVRGGVGLEGANELRKRDGNPTVPSSPEVHRRDKRRN